MPGFVQMLAGLDDMELFENGITRDDLADLGASEPPALVGVAVRSLVSDPAVKSWLHDVGRWIVRRGLGDVREALTGKPKPSSPWMTAVFDPIIDQIKDGAINELARRSRPYLWGVSALVGLGALGVGALIGSTRRCRALERTASAPR